MAGSLKNVKYRTNNGDVFYTTADESNWGAIHGANNDYTPADVGVVIYGVPRNISMRYATYGLGARRIRIPVTDTVTFDALEANTPTITDPITPSQTLILLSKTPEKRKLPRPDDTGLNDGDLT